VYLLLSCIMTSANSSDSLFGPVATSRSFDFTLLFEDTILTIVPATLFLVAAGARVLWLVSKPNKVATSISRFAKLASSQNQSYKISWC
jgi:ATP-binding cassette subfamily C (CFTR/MRP) protein 1